MCTGDSLCRLGWWRNCLVCIIFIMGHCFAGVNLRILSKAGRIRVCGDGHYWQIFAFSESVGCARPRGTFAGVDCGMCRRGFLVEEVWMVFVRW